MNNVFYIANTANYLQELLDGLKKRETISQQYKQQLVILPTTRANFNIKKKLKKTKLTNTDFYVVDNPTWLEMILKSSTRKNFQKILSKQEAIFILSKFMEQEGQSLLYSMKLAINLLNQYEIKLRYTENKIFDENDIIENKYLALFYQKFIPHLKENNILLHSEYYVQLVDLFLNSNIAQQDYKIIFTAIDSENLLYKKMLQHLYKNNHYIILNYFTSNCKEIFQTNNYHNPDYYAGKFCLENRLDTNSVEQWLVNSDMVNITEQYHASLENNVSAKFFANEHLEAIYIVNFLKTINKNEKIALITMHDEIMKKILLYAKAMAVDIDIFLHNQFNQTHFFYFIKLIFYNLKDDNITTILSLLKHPYISMSDAEYSKICQCELEIYEKKLNNKHAILSYIKDDPQYEKIKNILSLILQYEKKFKYNNKMKIVEIIKLHLLLIEELCGDNIWTHKDAITFREIMAKIFAHQFIEVLIDTHDFLAVIDIIISSYNFQEEASVTNIVVVDFHHVKLLDYDRYIIAGANEKYLPTYRILNEQYLEMPLIKEMNQLSFATQSQIFFSLIRKNTLITCVNTQEKMPSKWLELVINRNISTLQYDFVRESRKGQYAAHITSNISSICPPLNARPKSFSPTSFSYLLRDPYGYYLKYILKIYPIEKNFEDSFYKNWGNLLHKIIQETASISTLTEHDMKLIMQNNYQKYFSMHGNNFWQYKLNIIAKNFSKILSNLREEKYLEIFGKCELILNDVLYNFHAIADYIGVENDQIEIIDFKTGSIPSLKDVYSGIAPQMGILAMIVKKHGFDIVKKKDRILTKLSYGKISTTSGYEDIVINTDIEEFTKNIEEMIIKTLNIYNDINYPYKDLKNNSAYDDYKYIKR